MPEMDGLEATQRLRQEPCFASLPIIALTAHALDGDRDRCLAAGMNDYLSKPFTTSELLAVLARWTDDEWDGGPLAEGVTEPEAQVPMDLESLAQALGEDQEFVLSLVAEMVESGAGLIEQLHVALDASDVVVAERATHSLKGSAAMVRAEPLRKVAEVLEQRAREGDLDALRQGVPELENAFQQLCSWYADVAAQPTAGVLVMA